MRDLVIKLKNWLLWVIGLSIIISGFGFGVFIGGISMDPKVYIEFPIHSFFGLEFYVFLAFGGYLIIFCSFLLLPLSSGINRDFLSTHSYWMGYLTEISYLLIIFGIEFIGYALLLDVIPSLTELFPWHRSFDYIIWGTFFFLVGLPPLAFRHANVELKKSRSLVFTSCVILGIVLLGFSWIEYSYIFWPTITRRLWGLHFILGNLFLLGGGLPLSISYMGRKPTIFGRANSIFLVIGLLGGIIYSIPTIIHNGFLPIEILRSYHYFELLAFGLLLMVMGLIPIAISEVPRKTIYRYKNLLLAILAVGIAQIGIAGLLVMLTGPIQTPTSFEPTLLFMTWDVWWFNGVTASLLSLIFIIPNIFSRDLPLDAEASWDSTEEPQLKR
jgi:hypothetical protein